MDIDYLKWNNLLSLIERDHTILRGFIDNLKIFISLEGLDDRSLSKSWKDIRHSSNEKDMFFTRYIEKLTYINRKRENLLGIKNKYRDIVVKDEIYLHGLLDSYIKFEAMENDGMDNVVSLYLNMAKYIIKLKVKAKSLYRSDSSNENYRELLKLIQEFYNYMALYKSEITENILYRFESLSEHGFVNQPLLSIVNQFSPSSEKITLDDFSGGWTKDRFNLYFNFITNGISADHKSRMANINWGFGIILRRDDGVLAAFPSIFKSNELLLIKPWFGFIFRGRMLLYTLFSDSYLQLSIYHKHKRASDFINQMLDMEAAKNNEGIADGLNSILIAIDSLESEFARVDSEYRSLWWIFSAHAIDICKRWLLHVNSQKTILLNSSIKLATKILSEKDIMLDLMSSKKGHDNFIKVVKVLNDSKLPDCYDNFSGVNNVIAINILRNIFECLLYSSINKNKSKIYLDFIFKSDFKNILISILGSEDYYYLSKLNNILQDTSNFPTKDIYTLLLKLYTKFNFENVICDIDPAFVENNSALSTLLQCVINKEYVKDGSLTDSRFNEALQSMSLGLKGGLRFPGITNCPKVKAPNVCAVIDSLLQKNEVGLTTILSSLAFRDNFNFELFLYPKGHQKLTNAINVYRKSQNNICPYLQQLILDYGDNGAKISYGFDIAIKDLDMGKSLVMVLEESYVKILREINIELSSELTSLIQQHAFAVLENAVADDDLCRVNSLLEGSNMRESVFYSGTILHDLDLYLKEISDNNWSRSLIKVMSVLATREQLQNYFCMIFRSLALYDESYDLSDILLYLKEMAVTNEYFWSCFGLSIARSNHLEHILSLSIKSSYDGFEKYEFLELVLGNNKFCDFHNLLVLQQQWQLVKLQWQCQIEIDSSICFLEHNMHFIENANDKLCFIISWLEDNVQVKNYEIYYQEKLKKLVELIWHDFANMVKSNLLSSTMFSLNSYKDVIERLLCLETLNSELSLQLNFLLWVISVEPYISTTPIRVFHSIQDGLSTSTWMNSLSLYLLLLGAYPESLKDKVILILGDYKSLISISGVVFFWQKQILNIHNDNDPFLLLPALQDTVDKVVIPVNDNGIRDEVYVQLEHEFQRIEKLYVSKRIEHDDIQFLKISLNTLQVSALGATSAFKDNVDLLISRINLLITAIEMNDPFRENPERGFVGINIFATIFNSPILKEEDLCKTQISHCPC
ncbi:MAG: hypothetical protein HON78_01435 [Legionellales bacterium]|nr:hypothetical protein [Legionellales bacterium]